MNLEAHDDAARPSDPDGDEARLRALFDASVEPAAGPTLTKLLARAADVPERSRRTPFWLPRWAWKPTAAGLVVAVGALGAALFNVPIDAPEPSAPAIAAARMPSAPEPAAAVSVADPESMSSATAAFDSDQEGELETLGIVAFDGEWDSDADEEDVLDALYGPASDENLDAWLYATTALLQGGG